MFYISILPTVHHLQWPGNNFIFTVYDFKLSVDIVSDFPVIKLPAKNTTLMFILVFAYHDIPLNYHYLGVAAKYRNAVSS